MNYTVLYLTNLSIKLYYEIYFIEDSNPLELMNMDKTPWWILAHHNQGLAYNQ